MIHIPAKETMIVTAVLFAAGCTKKNAASQIGVIDPIMGMDHSGIEPFKTFSFGPNLSGKVFKSIPAENTGMIVTFSGLDTDAPRVSFSTSSGFSPLRIIFNTDQEIGLQLNTGSSLDSFIIDKRTGFFARTWSGTSPNINAGASVGACM